ncbi:R3H domain-containing nucleic acid-binding protein [Erysipelothrix urinaevulpis]|uniref:Jag family protein n=1 Tax=Erysipelothrix urinaevulpis TaxID=2683717 RepID=UPI001359177A|nr:R3H domain-containing nucleic acid-binding protein [Erysipelothrix urinaevulpis]
MKQYTARTIEDVLNEVALEKNTSVEELTYHILEEKSGFLGFGASVTAEVFAPQDVEEFVKEYFTNFFEGLGLEVECQVVATRNNVTIDLNAENNAILIGKNGSSLNGMSNLIRSVISSKFKRRFYVNFDINSYKKNRYQKLMAMAQRVAKTVQRTKIDAALDPMSNDERKVIHKELQSMPNIKTQSEGSGRNRHLKIMYDGNKE